MFAFLSSKPAPTQPSGPAISKPWADGPLKLMPTVASYRNINDHVALHMANEMVLVHNIFFRAFNAILLQGPHLPSHNPAGSATTANPLPSSPPTKSFNPTPITSLLTFTRALIHTLHHHHDAEELAGFPAFERALNTPGLMAVAAQQHAAFHAGLDALDAHCEAGLAEPEAWEWGAMKRILDGFLPALEQHLREEIEMFVGLERFENEEGLREGWAAMEKKAVEAGLGALYDIFPIVFSCHDRTYENGLHAKFPPIPAPMKYAVVYWTSGTHKDAWRFAPCDLWSRPRPLMFMGGDDQPEK